MKLRGFARFTLDELCRFSAQVVEEQMLRGRTGESFHVERSLPLAAFSSYGASGLPTNQCPQLKHNSQGSAPNPAKGFGLVAPWAPLIKLLTLVHNDAIPQSAVNAP